MASMVDAGIVKAKQAWQVLRGKLISLDWRDRGTRIALLEAYVRSIFLYSCIVWVMTKLDGRGSVGVDCTGEHRTFYRSCMRSILNVGHTTRNFILYVLAGTPPLSVYITKTVTQFAASWYKGNCLVAKVARYTLQLDSVQGPNQLNVVAVKLTAETFSNRGQLYRNIYYWV